MIKAYIHTLKKTFVLKDGDRRNAILIDSTSRPFKILGKQVIPVKDWRRRRNFTEVPITHVLNLHPELIFSQFEKE
jgi:hypothetical protein